MDCDNDELQLECSQLSESYVLLEPHPIEKRLELKMTRLLKIPLNLTLQRGACHIDCGGGYIENCTTVKKYDIWQNVVVPFHFKNCPLQHHYCVRAHIGECCMGYTDTVFMKDYTPEELTVEASQWNLVIYLICLITFTIASISLLRMYFWRRKEKIESYCHLRRRGLGEIPNSCNSKLMDCENTQRKTTVFLLYIKEKNQLFIKNINYLKSFLKKQCIKVVDVYDEETEISRSVYLWADAIVRNYKIKVLLLDTEVFRKMLNGKSQSDRERGIVEQAVVFVYSCITDEHLFIVRFQNYDPPRNLLGKGNGACFLFPLHEDKLIEMIFSHEP